MRPRTQRQKEVVRLSGQLAPLTAPQLKWARTTHAHFAYRLKSGVTTCMDCGEEWIEHRNGSVLCPNCRQMVEIKDTKERVLNQKTFFNVTTAKGEYTIVRMFMLLSEMRKGYRAKFESVALGEYWIDSKGGVTVMGLCRGMNSYYYDVFNLCSPFEIRKDNEAFQRIAGEWVYPRIKVAEIVKRNGFKNSIHSMHPVTLIKELITNPHAETLMKAGEIEILRHLTYHPAEVDKYWNSVKIAMRHGYKIEDVSMWFDYIRMLDRMGKDLNSPSLLMPSDLKASHDQYVQKVNRQVEKERRERERQQAIADQTKFEELKSRYFGLTMTDGTIDIHTLDTIDDYYEVGNREHICCGSSKYYLKEKSLVLVAYIADKQIATIEISLSDCSILQCRGFANGSCEYSKQIEAIINSNVSLIEARKTA